MLVSWNKAQENMEVVESCYTANYGLFALTHRPTQVFSVHFVLTLAHPGITSWSVTHLQIAPGQACLTSEFFRDRLPGKEIATYWYEYSINPIKP